MAKKICKGGNKEKEGTQPLYDCSEYTSRCAKVNYIWGTRAMHSTNKEWRQASQQRRKEKKEKNIKQQSQSPSIEPRALRGLQRAQRDYLPPDQDRG
jgi:hypothetical protein